MHCLDRALRYRKLGTNAVGLALRSSGLPPILFGGTLPPNPNRLSAHLTARERHEAALFALGKPDSASGE